MEGIVACYESLVDESGEWLEKPRAPSVHLLCLEMEAQLCSAWKNHPQATTML
jgi:hypothetical protein